MKTLKKRMSGKQIVITVECDPGDLTENKTRRMFWRKRARLTALQKSLARLAWRNAGSPVAPDGVQVIVDVNLYRGRKLDEVNAWQGMKAMMDGLLVNAITKNDGPDLVKHGTLRQFTGREEAARPAATFVVRW